MRVNGETARPGHRADPWRDTITLDGALVRPAPPVYLAMNKPAGFACTRRDPHLPRTVYQILPDDLQHVYTVGRLDVDSEGLILFTNDGDWANGILHPSRHVEKTYIAEVRGALTRGGLDRLRRGLTLEDGPTLPARVSVLWERSSASTARLAITIIEGRKRQVRRMLAAVGLSVSRLLRTRIGDVELGDLPPGRWRELERSEVDGLRRGPEGDR